MEDAGGDGRLTTRHLRIACVGPGLADDPEEPPRKRGTNDDRVSRGGELPAEDRRVTSTMNLHGGLPGTPSGNATSTRRSSFPRVRGADRLRHRRKRGEVVRRDGLRRSDRGCPNDGRVAACGRNPPACGSAQALVRTGSRCPRLHGERRRADRGAQRRRVVEVEHVLERAGRPIAGGQGSRRSASR